MVLEEEEESGEDLATLCPVDRRPHIYNTAKATISLL